MVVVLMASLKTTPKGAIPPSDGRWFWRTTFGRPWRTWPLWPLRDRRGGERRLICASSAARVTDPAGFEVNLGEFWRRRVPRVPGGGGLATSAEVKVLLRGVLVPGWRMRIVRLGQTGSQGASDRNPFRVSHPPPPRRRSGPSISLEIWDMLACTKTQGEAPTWVDDDKRPLLHDFRKPEIC